VTIRAYLITLRGRIREALVPDLRALREENARLRGDAADFHMAYRMKCDEETKAQAVKVERLRAELARLTTLRPANEWDGETYVLWWRDWDDAGWVIDSVSDSQESGWWTPVFDASLPALKGTK